MRLVSYNILDGGEGRADPLAEVIAAQRADVVALIEADNDSVVNRIAERLRMEFVQGSGHRHSVALLSRSPIVESVNHALIQPGMSNCFLEATVHQGPDRDWVLGVIHLHPGARDEDDRRRQSEIAAICEVFADHRRDGRPHLLVGDFNSDSPIQIIDPDRCKASTRKSWQVNGGHLPRGAIQKLLDAGYVDTLHALRPQDAPRLGTFTTQFPGQRVDYVFSFGFDIRLKSAWIEHDRLAQFASDHYPIGVEIE